MAGADDKGLHIARLSAYIVLSAPKVTTLPVESNSGTMGFLTTTFDTIVTTPIPDDVDAQAVIAVFHDHGFIITMQPIVTRHELRDRDPATGEQIYDVWENIDLLPFGLWKHEIQFTAAFKDKTEGTISTVHAPLGFVSKANYTIKPGTQFNGEGTGWVLEEQIETTCPTVFKWFIESTMVPVRQKMHEQIIDNVRKREDARRSAESANSRPASRPPGNFI